MRAKPGSPHRRKLFIFNHAAQRFDVGIMVVLIAQDKGRITQLEHVPGGFARPQGGLNFPLRIGRHQHVQKPRLQALRQGAICFQAIPHEFAQHIGVIHRQITGEAFRFQMNNRPILRALVQKLHSAPFNSLRLLIGRPNSIPIAALFSLLVSKPNSRASAKNSLMPL